jgi:hypothetical protein
MVYWFRLKIRIFTIEQDRELDVNSDISRGICISILPLIGICVVTYALTDSTVYSFIVEGSV